MFAFMSDNSFIEINRVLSDENKMNVNTKPETIAINSILSYRDWHKGDKDKAIEGPITLIVLKSDSKGGEAPKKTPTMLINEDYNDFRDRLNTKAVVKKLN